MKKAIILIGMCILIITGCVKTGICVTYEQKNKCNEEIRPYTNESWSLYHPNWNEDYHTCCWKELRYNETKGYYSEETCRGFVGDGEDIIEHKRFNITEYDCEFEMGGSWKG